MTMPNAVPRLLPTTTPTVLVGLLSFAWIVSMSPWLDVFQIDPDEGLNLGKAALVAAGYSPYGDIWNDQGPVLTYLLAALQFVLPNDVHAARLLIAAAASLLLAGLHAAVRRDGGGLAAAATVVLLFTCPHFLQLSSAVMIGLPAIAFAGLSLAIAGTQRLSPVPRAVVSGLVFGLSLQTKLFTFTMAPALMLAVSGIAASGVRHRPFRAVAIWMLACALAFAIIAVVSGQDPIASLVAPHVAPALRTQHDSLTSLATIWTTLRQSPTVTIPGLLGLAVLLLWPGIDRRPLAVPGTWLATAGLALALHHPVFTHQVLLLIVPLAWIAGLYAVSLGTWAAALPVRIPAPGTTVALVACAAIIGVSKFPAPEKAAAANPYALSALALHTYAPLGGWVVTDVPMAAFRNGLLVPPELVVFSEKRRTIGKLTDADLLASIERRKPTQVVFQRFTMPAEVHARLAGDYLVAHRGIPPAPYLHYVRRMPELQLDRPALGAELAGLVERMAATSVDGGYAVAVDPATGRRFGESMTPIPTDVFWMLPAGATFEIGERFLRAFALTGDARFQDLALRTALAVVRSQTCDGGWPPAATVDDDCSPRYADQPHVSFDEGMQAGIIGFLVDVALTLPPGPGRDEILTAARDALGLVLETQKPDGAWPQLLHTNDYTSYATLNDDVVTSHIDVLLRAYTTFGDERYLVAAKRGLEFLLAAQLASGGWAQQYDDQLRPARGRAFEPAAAASIETAYAIRTLLEAFARLGDERLLAAAGKAADWLVASQTGPETWSRFYEIGSNRPIFGDRDGSVHYALGEISRERRDGYRWSGRFPDVLQAIRLAKAARRGAADYDAEKAVIAQTDRLAGLARALKMDPETDAVENGALISAITWLARVDDLLAAIAFSGER